MEQRNLFFDPTRLFEELCTEETLQAAFKSVKKNKGAPGIDGVSTEDFETNLDKELGQLKQDLLSWTYKPQPVRLVEIPKPGTDEKRKLGVPTVRDRTLQTAIKQLLEPILEPLFSEHSYGFRPGRNQQQAVEAARAFVISGKEWCVDIDLSKFFDRVCHDRLMSRLTGVISDKRILRLIGLTLRSGIMHEGVVLPTTEGTTQGSPLSPLLSNFVLDELDKRLEQRGYSFCRFADDLNAYVGSKKAAERLMENLTGFIEGKLKLKVNREKSKVAQSRFVKFLGMTIVAGTLAISQISLSRAMTKVKELSPRGTHLSLEQSIEAFNSWYRGWANYYKMTQYPAQLAKIEGHFRRRMRARLVDQHRNRRSLFKKLRKFNVPKQIIARTILRNRGRWALSHTRAVEMAFSNQWFAQMGLFTMSDLNLNGWFERRKWIRLT